MVRCRYGVRMCRNLCFGKLDIPTAEISPYKVVEQLGQMVKTKMIIVGVYFGLDCLKAMQDPLVTHRNIFKFYRCRGFVNQLQNKARRVP